MTLKRITLWSWLTKQEAKNEILCPPDLVVSNEDFAVELASQIEANRVPAEVELCEVNWDDTNTEQIRILVRHTGAGTTTDVVQLLVGVDQVGNFTYVEEKVYLKPPALPRVPRDKKADIGLGLTIGLLAFAGISLLCSLCGLVNAFDSNRGDAGSLLLSLLWPLLLCGLPALIAAGMASGLFYKSQQVAKWNKEAKREQKAWDEAWGNWNKEVLEAAYLAKTDDVFGRFALAVSGTIKQVIRTLFEDRQAELQRRTEEARTQKEIEEEMEKRKEEAFK